MKYKISYQSAHRHFVKIHIETKTSLEDKIQFQLSSWRPGRYELGNFAKNIRDVKATDQYGNILPIFKITKDRWEINNCLNKEVHLSYLYYSNEVNAGSCYLDENMLYINPIQCCMYQVGKRNNPLSINICIPSNYLCTIPEYKKQADNYIFENFDDLVETPFICSPNLQKLTYTVNNYEFRIWFEGIKDIPKEKILTDFTKFTEYQLNKFGSLPVPSYDFIFLITPFKSYHGVEHTANTVICLGPDETLFSDEMYYEFLHISSHELYHCWNIKNIRPKSMKPYNYTQENYSPLGYIYEGLTTYMGDLILWESGVFTNTDYQKSVNKWLSVHFNNFGNEHYSVADSSWDTWLDGYTLGIPNRKVSIYQDGALCMFMLDACIRENSNTLYSLHTFMENLYKNPKIQEEGYTEEDIINAFINLGGKQAKYIIENYIYNTKDYREGLKKAFGTFNWDWKEESKTDLFEGYLGMVVAKNKNHYSITKVIDDSIADKNKIAVGDKIQILGQENNSDFIENSWKNEQEITFLVETKYQKREIKMNTTESPIRVYSAFNSKIK